MTWNLTDEQCTLTNSNWTTTLSNQMSTTTIGLNYSDYASLGTLQSGGVGGTTVYPTQTVYPAQVFTLPSYAQPAEYVPQWVNPMIAPPGFKYKLVPIDEDERMIPEKTVFEEPDRYKERVRKIKI